MRDFLLPVGLLGVVLAIVYVWWTIPVTPVMPRAEPVFASLAPSQPAKAKQPQTVQPKLPEATPAVEVHTPDLAHTVAVVTPPLSIPPPRRILSASSAAEVGVGMPARRVVELLGKPDLTATTVGYGGLLETYIYTDTGGQDFLRIQLRAGRVVNDAR